MGDTLLMSRRMGAAALVGVLLYGLLFVALSIDIFARVWTWRFRFESPIDVVVLLYFEGSRTLITLAGLMVAATAMVRARHHDALRWLALGLAWTTVAYTKAVGFASFPGALQHEIAGGLRAANVPQWLLLVLFAHPEWAMWLAVPALLAFAARYPRPLTPADVTRQSGSERTGTLRSVALAGADVGSMSRRMTAALLRGGWLTGWRPWLVAATLGALHTAALLTGNASGAMAANAGAVVIVALAAAAFIALLRGGALAAAGPGEDAPIRWLRRAGSAGLALFALSALAGALLPGSALSVAAFTLAPAAVAAACLLAVLSAPRA
jgi:hypothetical protein